MNIKYSTIINHNGRGTAIPTISSVKKLYESKIIDKQQATLMLYDWGLVSKLDLIKVNK